MDLGIIGGADGPTTILVSANASELAWTLAILVVAAAAALASRFGGRSGNRKETPLRAQCAEYGRGEPLARLSRFAPNRHRRRGGSAGLFTPSGLKTLGLQGRSPRLRPEPPAAVRGYDRLIGPKSQTWGI